MLSKLGRSQARTEDLKTRARKMYDRASAEGARFSPASSTLLRCASRFSLFAVLLEGNCETVTDQMFVSDGARSPRIIKDRRGCQVLFAQAVDDSIVKLRPAASAH